MATKYYLDQPGLERLVAYINDALVKKANVGDVPTLPNDIVRKVELEDYALKTDIVDLPEDLVHQDDLEDYALKEDIVELPQDLVHQNELNVYALKQDIENLHIEDYATDDDIERLEGLISGVYRFCGTVADLDALQAIQNPQEGDVYNIANTGMNAAWDGTRWDDFGSIVDLSNYLTKEDIQAIGLSEINEILYSGTSAVVSDREGINAMLTNNQPTVEITLNKNLSVSTPIAVPEGKEVVLDLGGNTVSGATPFTVDGGELTIKNGDVESSSYAVVATNGATVVVDGANITSTNIGISAKESTVFVEDGEITAQECGVLGVKNSVIYINGGTFESWDNCPIMGNGSPAGSANDGTNADFIMNGGKLIAHIQSPGYIAAGIYIPNSGSFTMNGGEIISDGAGLVMRGGRVVLNGGSIIANGTTGTKGKVGDSRVVVGPYAVVYDAQSKYPAVDTLELHIGEDMVLQGTDGDIDVILEEGREANITDNRTV